MDQQITATISQPTIEELREKLVKWRKIKKYNREPVPRDIWKDATELAKKYSIYKVSKALSLNYVNKIRLKGRTDFDLTDLARTFYQKNL